MKKVARVSVAYKKWETTPDFDAEMRVADDLPHLCGSGRYTCISLYPLQRSLTSLNLHV
jgi:hypothetical protein